MGEDAESGPVPALALIGAGALIGFTLLAVTIGRHEGIGISGGPSGNPVATIALTVQDGANGSIRVEDAVTRRLIAWHEAGGR